MGLRYYISDEETFFNLFSSLFDTKITFFLPVFPKFIYSSNKKSYEVVRRANSNKKRAKKFSNDPFDMH